VADDDQVMLVTNKGKVIRIPVDGIRITGRNTQGVTLFNVDEDEQVVSVARLEGAAEANGGDGTEDAVEPDRADEAPAPDGDGSQHL
jgi:DNA gyrase subunit A